MRFQLNFAAVVRNVAVMANVAILAVVRFVAAYRPVHTPYGNGTTHETAPTRGGFRWRSDSEYLSDACASCSSSSIKRMLSTGVAFALVSSADEITSRKQQERLMAQMRRGSVKSIYGIRG
jgi:hypothetical protein